MERRNGHAKEVSVRCLDKRGTVVKDDHGIPVLFTWMCRNRECREAACPGTDPGLIAVVHYFAQHGTVELAACAGYDDIRIPEGERVTRCVPKPGASELLAALKEHQHGSRNTG